jgi:hypothetical protein
VTTKIRLLLFLVFICAALMLFIAGLLHWPLPKMPDTGTPGDFVIRHVGVVDVHKGTVWRDREVTIRNGVITSIGAAESSPAQHALIEIDGRGKFLIPGLWDMHTHSSKLAAQYYHPLLIANGVTGVREMWGCMSEPDSFIACIEDRRQWNNTLRNHSGLSPRFVLQGSFQINGGNEVPAGFPDYFKARNALEARNIVEFYSEAGADFLKTYSELSLASYTALAMAARQRGIALAGHRPLGVSLEQMLEAGQRSVEHPRLFLFECYRHATAFRALPAPLAAYDHSLRQRLVEEQDAERCEELIHTMANSETWWVPTLQVLKMSALAGDNAFRNDPRLQYIPYVIREGMWMGDADRAAAATATESGTDVYGSMYEMALAHVGKAHAAGVKILVGTDAGDTYVFPGFSVHSELAELVAAGISPADALKAATIDAAIFSGAGDQYGSIEVGKAADMILLDANPLADIANTETIRGLFFNGQFYARSDLDQLLDFARREAGSLQTNLQLVWAVFASPLMRVQIAD